MKKMLDSTSEIPQGYELCTKADGAFDSAAGPLFIRFDGKGFAFRVGAKHCNARDVVHGGMLMTFADQVLGLMVQREVGSVEVVTVSFHCDMVSGAVQGELIEGEAVVTHVTRSIVFVRGLLRSGDRPVLTASGLWKRLKPRPKEAA